MERMEGKIQGKRESMKKQRMHNEERKIKKRGATKCVKKEKKRRKLRRKGRRKNTGRKVERRQGKINSSCSCTSFLFLIPSYPFQFILLSISFLIPFCPYSLRSSYLSSRLYSSSSSSPPTFS